MASVSSPGEIQSNDILRAEIDAINQRREALGRAKLSAENCGGPEGCVIDAVGLALSGGGVRSAAFSLGVLQAINHNNALRNIDYLSTVSGGGYMGCALSATMTRTQGQFVFGNAPPTSAGPAASEIADTPAVGHLRNYANYLIPAGARDAGTAAVIVLRGLAANFAAVIALVMLAAAFTIMTNPSRTDLGCPDFFGFNLCDRFEFLLHNFALTLICALAGLAALLAWAVYRSLIRPNGLFEFRTRLPAAALVYVCGVLVVFFVELQAFAISGMFQIVDLEGGPDPLTWTADAAKSAAVVLAPVAALVTFFRQQMGELLKASGSDANISTNILAVLSKAGFWVAGAALPMLVWVLYLYLCFWGTINDQNAANDGDPQEASSTWDKEPFGNLSPYCSLDSAKLGPRVPAEKPADGKPSADEIKGGHTPSWMIEMATGFSEKFFCPLFWPVFKHSLPSRWTFRVLIERPLTLAYGTAGLLALFLVLLMRPNANSLHRLYRDRLSKAFLFDPRERDGPAPARNEASIDQGRDFMPLDTLPISALSAQYAPYQLINAALNIQGSDYANRRGRNADFFVFTPRHVGSHATGYAQTADLEKSAPGLNVATAMAISGAAASSNMGLHSVRPLRPTLALLNVRLGYWLKNPRYAKVPRKWSWWRITDRPSFFLLNEIFGRLYENRDDVYLSDGGHIENLGVYELLRRRCKLIVVVDAEADIPLRFPSFITLQRYARIDLGVRIDMPWSAIHDATTGWMGVHSKGQGGDAAPTEGPHAAIGSIDYGEGRVGTILYLKASLSGDENDYIRDYARRFPLFPQETTGDQFISEEQFEVYRALGFHIAHGVLSKRDDICVAAGSGRADKCKFDSINNATVQSVRAALTG
jgi:hypothetical protein